MNLTQQQEHDKKMNEIIGLSKAKNGYDLCLDVIDAMLAEPKRVDMGSFCRLDRSIMGPAPMCGTVGCFAGWVNIMAFGRRVADQYASELTKATLGKGLKYTFRDTKTSLTRDYFNAGNGDGIGDSREGTPEYAIKVVQRIRRFMKVNQKGLKARVINAKVKRAALKAVWA
jgi:hypothetical protein